MSIKTAIITMVILSGLFLIAGSDLSSKISDRRAEFAKSIDRLEQIERQGY